MPGDQITREKFYFSIDKYKDRAEDYLESILKLPEEEWDEILGCAQEMREKGKPLFLGRVRPGHGEVFDEAPRRRTRAQI